MELEIKAKCRSCNKEATLTKKNSVLVVFEKAIYLSFWVVTCDRQKSFMGSPSKACGNRWFFWCSVDQNEAREYVRHFLREDWPHEIRQNPTEKVIADYEESVGFEIEKPIDDIGPRLEAMLERFHEVMEATTSTHLMMIFSSPPPKSNLPRKWR